METLRVTIVLKTNEGGRWIIPHLQEMLARGFQVTVILPGGPGRLKRLLSELNVTVQDSVFDFSFSPSIRTIRGLWGLRRQIKRTRANILHYHLYASALAVRLASVGLRIPKVHMVAGPLYLDSPLIRIVERGLMFLDSVLVAGSVHTARRYADLGLPSSRLAAVPYGIDTDRFRPAAPSERDSARATLGLKPHEFVVVMVAYVYGPKNLVHPGLGIKGHDVLLAAWNEFVQRHPASRLYLVGSGFDTAGIEHRRELMERYSDKNLNIEWVENVADVRPYYWAADISVSPSLSENHGAALEAGACGVPRIVSDAGGLPETTDASSGWVVPRGDQAKLRQALESAYACYSSGGLVGKGTASRFQVEESFDDKRAASELVDILQGVAKSGGLPESAAYRGVATNSRAVLKKRSYVHSSRSALYPRLKRALDLVFSAILLVVTLPLQLVVYLAVLRKLGRPVIFRQSRPGLYGAPFELYKFRTMRNEDSAAGLVSDEDRMTAFGSWLRATSLDELPTLVNVLRGDMSMVGPRPLLARYLDRYSGHQSRRHEVRPGITGLAQVSGRNALGWESKLDLDVRYVDNMSLWLDTTILMRTVGALARPQEVREPGHATKSEFLGSTNDPGS